VADRATPAPELTPPDFRAFAERATFSDAGFLAAVLRVAGFLAAVADRFEAPFRGAARFVAFLVAGFFLDGFFAAAFRVVLRAIGAS
jgi:hypothetical protein